MSQLVRPLLLSVTQVVSALKLPVLVANPFSTHRVPLHAQNFPLVLLYTARAGSAALIRWFLFQTGHLDQPAELHKGVHQLSRSVQLRYRAHGWEALRVIVAHRKPIFKLVRNPYDRAVSSFLSTVFHTREKQRNPWGRKLVTAARKYSGKPVTTELALSYRDFLRFVAMNGTEMGLINGHVARQHVAGEDGWIDRIIRLECFAEELRRIELEYGLARSPLESIARLRHEGSRLQDGSEGCAADLEITPKQVHQGIFPPYAAFYDDETRRLVRECFAVDFDAYRYET